MLWESNHDATLVQASRWLLAIVRLLVREIRSNRQRLYVCVAVLSYWRKITSVVIVITLPLCILGVCTYYVHVQWERRQLGGCWASISVDCVQTWPLPSPRVPAHSQYDPGSSYDTWDARLPPSFLRVARRGGYRSTGWSGWPKRHHFPCAPWLHQILRYDTIEEINVDSKAEYTA